MDVEVENLFTRPSLHHLNCVAGQNQIFWNARLHRTSAFVERSRS